jgi:hypothetical protein
MPGTVPRSPSLQTQWHAQDLLVLREGVEVERVHAADIGRVILAYHHGGHTAGDLSWALLELAQDGLLLPAESGIAGRVHFEHQEFWRQRHCIYWVDEAQAVLPRRLRLAGSGLLGRWRPAYLRVPRVELAPLLAKWPLQGPQTWEQRKWDHITRTRLLAPLDAAKDEAQARRRGG